MYTENMGTHIYITWAHTYTEHRHIHIQNVDTYIYRT
jgi:hypothetical protein